MAKKRKNKYGTPNGQIDIDQFRTLRMTRAKMADPLVWKIDFKNGTLRCGPIVLMSLKGGRHECRIDNFRYAYGVGKALDPNEAVVRAIKIVRDYIYTIRVFVETAELALAGGSDWSGIVAKELDEDARVAQEMKRALADADELNRTLAMEDDDERKFARYAREIEHYKSVISDLRKDCRDHEALAATCRSAKFDAELGRSVAERQLQTARKKLRELKKTDAVPAPKKSSRKKDLVSV